MNPLFLGTAERSLFAIHEPPPRTRGRPRAVLLCQPCGSEYVYAHRSMRQLALQLSGSGCHVLRFDYYGTGDSAGDAADGDLTGWGADTQTALETLKDISGAPKVAVVGLRVGANIAAGVAARLPGELEALVLWDPILSGEAYLRELQGLPGGEPAAPLAAALRGIDLRPLLVSLPPRSLLLLTQGAVCREELQQAAAGAPSPPALERLEAPCPWVESITNTGALPVAAFQRIEEWLR